MKVICNKCGKSSVLTSNINLSFEYDSKFDGKTFDMDICDDCLEEFMNSFIKAPDVFNKGGYWDILEEAYVNEQI